MDEQKNEQLRNTLAEINEQDRVQTRAEQETAAEKRRHYMTEQERQFSVKFAPYVNENNIIGLMDVLSDAQRDIEQNVNSKMVFFDLTLKTIMLMKQ